MSAPPVYPQTVAYSDMISKKDKVIKEQLRFNQQQNQRYKTKLQINSVGFADNEAFIAVANGYNVTVIDTENSEKTEEIEFEKHVTAVAVSHDSKYIAATTLKGELDIFERGSKNRSQAFPTVQVDIINKLAFSHDGSILAGINDEGQLFLWNVRSGMSQETLATSTVELKGLAFSRDDRHVVVSGFHNVEVWDVKGKQQTCLLRNAHKGLVWDVSFSADQKYLVSSSEDVKLWDGFSFEKIDVLSSNDYGVCSCSSVSKDNHMLISGTETGKILFWSLRTKKLLYAMERVHSGHIHAVQFASDDKQFVSVSSDKSVRTWNIDRDILNNTFNMSHSNKITCIAVSPDERYIATGSSDQTICIYDHKDHRVKGSCEGHQGDILKLIFRDKNTLISLANDNSIKFWELEGFTEIQTINSYGARSIALTPDRTTLLLSGHSTKYWRITPNPVQPEPEDSEGKEKKKKKSKKEKEEEKRKLNEEESGKTGGEPEGEVVKEHIELDSLSIADKYHKEIKIPIEDFNVTDIAVSADCQYVGVTDQRNVYFYKYDNQDEVCFFGRAHEEDIRHIAITNDNEYIITAGDTIKVWGIFQKDLYANFTSPNHSQVVSLHVTGNNRFIIATRYDTSCEVWDIRLKRLVHVYRNSMSQLNAASCISKNHNAFVLASENADNDVLVFQNLSMSPCQVSVGEHCGIDLKSRLGIFVLDSLLDQRDKNLRLRIIQDHPGLLVYPFEWNILHIAAIYFGDLRSAKACLEAGIKLSLDQQGLTPIHHQLKKAHPDFAFLSYIFEHFEQFLPEDPMDAQKIIESLSSVFLTLVGLGFDSVVNVLNYFVCTPIPARSVDVPEYGELRKKSLSQCSTRFIVTDVPHLKYTVARRHIASSYKPITLKMLRLKNNYELQSDEMMDLIHLLKETKNDNVLNAAPVKILTEYAWRQNSVIHKRLAFMHLIFLILLSVWAGDRVRESPGLSITSFVFGILPLVYEIVQLSVLGLREYFRSIYRTLDLIRYLLLILTFGYVWAIEDDPITEKVTGRGWLISLSLLTGYAKGLHHMRIYEQPRKLIRYLVQFIEDIRVFIILAGVSLIIFALCFMQFDESTNTFGNWMLYVFDFQHGRHNGATFNVSETILLIFASIFIVLVLLNILIAIALDTQEKIQNNIKTLEAREKLGITLEALIFSRFWKFFRCGSSSSDDVVDPDPDAVISDKVVRAIDEPSNKIGYLLYIGEHPDNEDYNEADKWNGRIQSVKKSIAHEIGPLKKGLGHSRDHHDNNHKQQKGVGNIIQQTIDREMNKAKESLRKQLRKDAIEANKEIAEDMGLIMQKLGVEPPKRDSARKKPTVFVKKRQGTRTNLAPKKKVGAMDHSHESQIVTSKTNQTPSKLKTEEPAVIQSTPAQQVQIRNPVTGAFQDQPARNIEPEAHEVQQQFQAQKSESKRSIPNTGGEEDEDPFTQFDKERSAFEANPVEDQEGQD